MFDEEKQRIDRIVRSIKDIVDENETLRSEKEEWQTKYRNLERRLKKAVISERKAREKARLAYTDPLTGAKNRRGYQKRLDRIEGEYCILIIDIDYFKNVNDTYGHSVGDNVLREFVQTLSKNVRLEDTIARYGGEEFVVIMPGCGIEEGVRKADQLRGCIAARQWESLDGGSLTASFGVAYGTKKDIREEIFKVADAVLYEAKKHGRNRVCYRPT